VRILALIHTFHIGKLELVRHGMRDFASMDSGVVMVFRGN
jgi:hypothetical protein